MSLDLPNHQLVEECPLDGGCRWQFLYHSGHANYHLPIHRCHKCQLQTVHPRNIDYQEMYGENYYRGKAEYSYRDERLLEKFDSYVWDARIRNIQKFKPRGNFLDIGCSFAGFLNRARLHGYTPYGVEVSEYSSKFARKRGIEVHTGNFVDLQLPANFFDVITLIEVIEHLDHPRKVFDELTRIIKPGGLLVIQTANFSGRQARQHQQNYHYYLPGHIYYYSLSNLQLALQQRGFSRFRPYLGVDFSLWAKLKKSRGSFQTAIDYLKWLQISLYHLKSKLFPGSTSSMVLYAWKDEE